MLGDRLLKVPVLGLNTGSELARTEEAIIDPSNLKIIAYSLSGPLLDTHPSFLATADIREISNIGLIIDSSDEFVTEGDIVKLDTVYSLGFRLPHITVIDQKKHKLGKVNGYTVNTSDFLIHQLSVKRPLFKSLSDTEILVHRSQIVEINNQNIIVRSEVEQVPKPIIESVQDTYVNPFRSNKPTAEHPTDTR